MSSRTSSEFGSLGDRIARTETTTQEAPVGERPVADNVEPETPAEATEGVDGQGKRREVATCHVWVDGLHAGILTSWWRPTTVWFGEVAWMPPDQPGAVALEWIESSRLRQA